MDGISGATAVIQLITTAYNISKFLRSLRDAPNEILEIAETLDQLQQNLAEVQVLVQKQNSCAPLPRPQRISSALEVCESRIAVLEKLVDEFKGSLNHQHLMKRRLAALRLFSKNDQVRKIQSQLRESAWNLLMALMINSNNLSVHQIQMTWATPTQDTTDCTAELPVTESNRDIESHVDDSIDKKEFKTRNSSREKEFGTPKESPPPLVQFQGATSITSKDSGVWYQGILGTMKFRTKSKSACNPQDHRRVSTYEDRLISIRPSFLRYALEIRVTSSFGRVTRSLRTYPLMSHSSPVLQQAWNMCGVGDIKGLQIAFTDGRLSPFTVDQNGMTFLHIAARHHRPEMCSWFLQLGLESQVASWSPSWLPVPSNSDKAKIPSSIPLTPASLAVHWDIAEGVKRMIDTCRILLPFEDDDSAFSRFFTRYEGPLEAAELMWSLYAEYYRDNKIAPCQALAVGLRSFANSPDWEPFLRTLLRHGLDLHVPLSCWGNVHWLRHRESYPWAVSPDSTLLDELFANTETPFEAKMAGDRWLQILASEGYDILDYLQGEKRWHAAQKQLTYPSSASMMYDTPRRLCFNLGRTLSVSWTWWIDPAFCSPFRNEFLYLLNAVYFWQPQRLRIAENAYLFNEQSWETMWPYWCPTNSPEGVPPRVWEEREAIIVARGERRAQKNARKAAWTANSTQCL